MAINKKIIFLLLVVVIIAGLLFIVVMKKTFNITVKHNETPLISDSAVNIPIDGTDMMYGNPGAPVTIVEFTDISCKQCQKMHYAIKDFISKNPRKARLVWKDAPRSTVFSEGDTLAHQAAYCAGQQNKFWQFADMAMQNPDNLSEAGLKKIAEGLNLDVLKFWQCANSDEAVQKIQASLNMAESLGIKNLPGIFIDNRQVNADADIDIQKLISEYTTKE